MLILPFDVRAFSRQIYIFKYVRRHLTHLDKLKPLNEELIGPNGKLDSLGIIMFIGTLENKTLEYTQREIALLNEEYLVDTNGPYKNLFSIREYIITLL